MLVQCENLRGCDWNFDYARNKRLEIRGLKCVIPEEIADKYPKYFKKIAQVVIDEPKQVIEEDVQVVLDEPKVEVPVVETVKASKRGKKSVK